MSALDSSLGHRDENQATFQRQRPWFAEESMQRDGSCDSPENDKHSISGLEERGKMTRKGIRTTEEESGSCRL